MNGFEYRVVRFFFFCKTTCAEKKFSFFRMLNFILKNLRPQHEFFYQHKSHQKYLNKKKHSFRSISLLDVTLLNDIDTASMFRFDWEQKKYFIICQLSYGATRWSTDMTFSMTKNLSSKKKRGWWNFCAQNRQVQ